MRERGEQRARCGEVETGVRFIRPGRRWGGGEVAGGGGVLILIGFDGVKGEEETGRCHFSGGVKTARWCFGSALRARRRAAVGGASQRRRWLRRWEVEDTRELGRAELLGRKATQVGRPARLVQAFWAERGRRE
jgi:hypothetical protein